MKNTLSRLINHEQLDKNEAKQILVAIAEGALNESEIAAFLTVYLMRTITIEELEGFRDALLDLCVKVDLQAYNTIDLCGTGGDGKNTFNISTLAAFVTAGAGIKVTKHGNYGVSSVSGSSNVLESLGVKFSNNIDFLENCIDQTGICILHAPLFHPAMKSVAPVRKQLGIKTFFNMLGPMVNPSFPKNQLVGVFNLEVARMYSYLYQKETKNYTIVHALDGYDEVSLTGPIKIWSNLKEEVITPENFKVKYVNQKDIFGGNTLTEASKLFNNIIQGKGTEAQNNVVCANAALAIATVKKIEYIESFEIAKTALLNGSALKCLKKLQQLSV